MPEVQGQELYAASPAASMGHVWADIPDDCDGTAELAVNADLLFDRNFGGCEKLHSVEGHIHACSRQQLLEGCRSAKRHRHPHPYMRGRAARLESVHSLEVLTDEAITGA